MITQADLDWWFDYHAPIGDEASRYAALRESAKQFASDVISLTPAGADQSAAIRKIREAVMTANAGIACNEKKRG